MATMGGEGAFVDTNVLVYASLAQSPLHDAAIAALNALRDEGTRLWVSRQVLREYAAVLTRSQATTLQDPIATAIADIRAFETLFQIAEDGPAVTAQLLDLMDNVPVGGKQIHDANIVATMLAHDLNRLLTHNVKDFRRFSAHITLLPLTP